MNSSIIYWAPTKYQMVYELLESRTGINPALFPSTLGVGLSTVPPTMLAPFRVSLASNWVLEICPWEKNLPGTLPEPNTEVSKTRNKPWFLTSFKILIYRRQEKGRYDKCASWEDYFEVPAKSHFGIGCGVHASHNHIFVLADVTSSGEVYIISVH